MSLLAVSVQFYGQPRIVARLKRGHFYPPPDVDSAIVRLDPHPGGPLLPPEETTRFFEVARAGFGQPRKQLKNSLAAGLGVDAEAAARWLERAGIDPRRDLKRPPEVAGCLLDGVHPQGGVPGQRKVLRWRSGWDWSKRPALSNRQSGEGAPACQRPWLPADPTNMTLIIHLPMTSILEARPAAQFNQGVNRQFRDGEVGWKRIEAGGRSSWSICTGRRSRSPGRTTCRKHSN